MSYKDHRIDLAAQILAGFAANPAIFAPNSGCGWSLVNCTDADIAGYAVTLADKLISANEAIPQGGFEKVQS
jgi:hypothetical protein